MAQNLTYRTMPLSEEEVMTLDQLIETIFSDTAGWEQTLIDEVKKAWLSDEMNTETVNKIYEHASKRGNLKGLKWLLEKTPYYPTTDKTYQNALRCGNPEVAKWMCEINREREPMEPYDLPQIFPEYPREY